MKNAIKLLTLLSALTGLLFLYSCKDEEPIVPVEVNFASATANVLEDEGTLDVTVSFGGAAPTNASFDVTLSGTAVYGSDYTTDPVAINNKFTVQVTAGETSKTITAIINDNDEIEGNKSIIMTITNATEGLELGALTELTATITEDDKEPVVIAYTSFEEVPLFIHDGVTKTNRNRYRDFKGTPNGDGTFTNTPNDPRDDANDAGRLLLDGQRHLAILSSIVNHVPAQGDKEIGFDTFWFDEFGANGGPTNNFRRMGVVYENNVNNNTTMAGGSDGFIWTGLPADASGNVSPAWRITADHHGKNAYRMSHLDGKIRLVLNPVDLSKHENIKVSLRLTTVRTAEFGTPLAGNENKPVIMDIYAAANVPTGIPQASKTGASVLQGMRKVALLRRQGAGMVPAGSVYADGQAQNAEEYLMVEELEFNISDRFAVLNTGTTLNNTSIVVEFQCPSREPTCIYVDNIVFKGTEK